jgi:hypothetical protein
MMSDSPVPESAAELERYLVGRKSPAVAPLGLPDEFVLPCYDLSIANLPGTLADLLGAELAGATSPLPSALWAEFAAGVRRVVWVILDAVGWLRFRQLLEKEPALCFARLAQTGRLFPITSTFPSTTTSALATLWTGYAPAQHGLVGSDMFLREFGMIVDTLGFCPAGEPRQEQMTERGLVPERFLPVPGLAERLAGQGVKTRVLIHVGLADSGLSRLFFRGAAEVSGFVTSADMWVSLRQILAEHVDERLLLVGYWAEVDGISHYQGPDSESWRAELRNLAFSLEREFLQGLSPREREGTLLVITADHGQITGGPESRVALADHPEMRDRARMPPTGGPRAAYLSALPGQVEALRRYLEEHLSEQFVVIDSTAALEAGLLGPGPPAAESPHRLGDLTVLARSDYMLDHRERERPLLGKHGGLSPWEMLAPLLLVRLD